MGVSRIFNTNNLWMDLRSVKELLEKDQLDMEIVVNNKSKSTIVPRNYLMLWWQVRDFLSRFASIPDMLELDHLTVSGDVTFGRGVTLKVCVIVTVCVDCTLM
ncbi:UGP2 [Cordylochernes scorpioides]|uniref:UTP--glucose-1-phosphate uridylyltransferase n=1 Tax=Cordylochernes scorpioides TaxID=51811 RepID=A0ABY6L0Z2_9ARAC|nr:UGP2 [Cordylochernes scorpioides]